MATSSSFPGRSFIRSGALGGVNETYAKNYIFDDVSSEFNSINNNFTLTSNGSNVTGIKDDNAIILINDVFQDPGATNNYVFDEPGNVGVTTLSFVGSAVSVTNDVGISSFPKGGIILSVGSTNGLGYQPLVAAGGTAVVSAAGTISSISIGNTGSGYRSGIQPIRVGVATHSGAKLINVGTASVSGGHVTGIAVTNVTTFSNIINESDYPSFFVTQNQSSFLFGEKVIVNDIPSKLTVERIDTGKLKIFGNQKLKVGDKLVGENSGSQCEVSNVIENRGIFETDFSILKNLNWSDDIGKLDEDFQVVSDNDYYQNMSYSIQSPIEWQTLRTQVNNLLHTSGMKNFADTEVLSSAPVGVGSTSNVNVIVDLINQKRVDEIKDIDLVRDVDVVGDSSRFVLFKNIRLTDFINCRTNDVLIVDKIEKQFSNTQAEFDDFIDIIDFSTFTSNEIFNEFVIVTKDTSTFNTFDKIQISNLLTISNGTKNVLVEKSNLINSGIGLTNYEENNFVDFELVGSKLRFSPNVEIDADNNRDYDLKIFTSKFNSDSVGVGTTSIGLIDLSSRVQTCTTGITTNLITVASDEFESLYATLHVIDDNTKEMNLVESFVSHSGTDTFLSEAYFNTDANEISLKRLGTNTSSISGENLFKYSLDALSKDILKDEKYKYDLQEKTFKWSGGMQKDPMSNMHKLPSHVVKDYAKQDVSLTFRLWKIFDKKLDEVLFTKPNGEQKTCRNIFELETKLFPCLVDM